MCAAAGGMPSAGRGRAGGGTPNRPTVPGGPLPARWVPPSPGARNPPRPPPPARPPRTRALVGRARLLGPPGRLPEQDRLGDFWLPQRGLFFFAQTRFLAPLPSESPRGSAASRGEQA